MWLEGFAEFKISFTSSNEMYCNQIKENVLKGTYDRPL
jgi:hypothetical protein